LIQLPFVVMVTGPVVMTHSGVGWDSRTGEHGNCDNCEQYVPEDSHDFCTFSANPAPLLYCGPVDACSMTRAAVGIT
jgi:hypothetical protein